MTTRATLFLLIGLPAAGKTTLARDLESHRNALRLTPDDWMLPLFGTAEIGDKRDIVEGQLIQLGLRAVQLGVNTVIDFGLWSRDERSALRWLAASVGADCELKYLPIDETTQRQRVRNRDDELSRGRRAFEVPDEAELGGTQVPDPPHRYATWSQWAAERWPTLPDEYGR